jgi:glucose/arabinose dehydrogenase
MWKLTRARLPGLLAATALAAGVTACDDDNKGAVTDAATGLDAATGNLDASRADAARDSGAAADAARDSGAAADAAAGDAAVNLDAGGDAGAVTDGGLFGDGAVPTDAGGGPNGQAARAFRQAFERQMAVNALMTDPNIQNNPNGIRAAATAAVPIAQTVLNDLQNAPTTGLNGVQADVQQAINDATQQLALLQRMAQANDPSLTLDLMETQAHGSVVVQNVNKALAGVGAGPSAEGAGPKLNAAALRVPAGYTADIVANDLDFASAVAVDENGTVFVGEAGYSYGDVRSDARVVRINATGQPEVVANGFNAPLTGLAVRAGQLYVSHAGVISRIDLANGQRTDLVSGLPSYGDHFNESIAVGPDGLIYFTQGTVTNTGITGLYEYAMGWLPRNPAGHDIACRDLTLAGVNFTTGNPLTTDISDTAVTGPFLPFGTPGNAGQVIRGQLPCSGAILRVRPDGSGLEMYADGLRNPFSLAFAADGRLLAVDEGPDGNGTRPVVAPDSLYQITQGGWYGYPDWYGGVPVTDASLQMPGTQTTPRVLMNTPPLATGLLTQFSSHATPAGMAVTPNGGFDTAGVAFIAQFGDLTPVTAGGVTQLRGQQVIRVQVGTVGGTGANASTTAAFLSSTQQADGRPLLRPTGMAFSPAGDTLYITHFGRVLTVPGGVTPTPASGALIRIRRAAQ